MYGKIFQSLYQGTLSGHADQILVFTNLLAFKDRDQFVDKHPKVIANEVGIPEERVRQALRELEAPDPESRSGEQGGARIERIDEHRDWGWFIINGAKYDAIVNEEERRRQLREAQARFRQKQGENVINSNQPSSDVIDSDQKSSSVSVAVPVAVKREGAFRPPTIEECREEMLRIGVKASDGDDFFNHHGTRGWKLSKGLLMKDWRLACQTWKGNIDKFSPSVVTGSFGGKTQKRFQDANIGWAREQPLITETPAPEELGKQIASQLAQFRKAAKREA